MTHMKKISQSKPALAFSEGHPEINWSILQFMKDPIGTILLHLNG